MNPIRPPRAAALSAAAISHIGTLNAEDIERVGNLEKWYQAVEGLPAKYPSYDIAAIFPKAVEFYLNKLKRDEVVELFRVAPAELVAEILHIIRQAFEEASGGDGLSGAGSPVSRPTGPSSREAATAEPLPHSESS